MINKIDDSNYKEKTQDCTAVIQFRAHWASCCSSERSTLEEIAQRYDGIVEFFEADVDNSQNMVFDFGIIMVPTIIIKRHGKIMDRIVGVQPKEVIIERIEKVLNPDL